VLHLRNLGLPNISEENIARLCVGRQRMTWVNFKPNNTKCPKQVLQQDSARVTTWSRKLSLRYGRFDKEGEEEEEQEEETEEMLKNEAEARMWVTAAGRSLVSTGNATATCGGSGSNRDCSGGEEAGGGLTPLVAGCLQLLGDMKNDAVILRKWRLFEKIEIAASVLRSFEEFEKRADSSRVSFLLRFDKRGDLFRDGTMQGAASDATSRKGEQKKNGKGGGKRQRKPGGRRNWTSRSTLRGCCRPTSARCRAPSTWLDLLRPTLLRHQWLLT